MEVLEGIPPAAPGGVWTVAVPGRMAEGPFGFIRYDLGDGFGNWLTSQRMAARVMPPADFVHIVRQAGGLA